MRYLPSEMVSEPFWAQLPPKIARLLKKTRVLRPWSGGPLKPLSQLKRVPAYFLDEAGDPLFEDVTNEAYLSAGYKDIDFELLEGLGVGRLSFEDILKRIRADLKDPFSRWRSSETSDDWITRSSSMLMRKLLYGDTAEAAQVKALPLIPLHHGTWVSSDTGSVYHSHSDGILVPTDLGLRLIDRRARRNPTRMGLFQSLGMRYCNPKNVIALILEKYYASHDVSLHCSVLHIRFLYRHLPENKAHLSPIIYLRDRESRPVYRKSVTPRAKTAIEDDLYFKTDDEYGPGELLKALPQSSDGTRSSAPGFPVHYLNSAYLAAAIPTPHHRKLTWEEWLEFRADVRRVPRLSCTPTQTEPSKVSNLFVYIIENRSDKLVGTLKAHWSSYQGLMTPEVTVTLSQAMVPCENGDRKQLQKSFLPLPSLERICEKRNVPQSFPFLRLPIELKEGEQHEWNFLEKFGVVCQQNRDFHLECLRLVVRANQESQGMSSKSLSNLIEIYQDIEEYGSGCSYEPIKYVLSLTPLQVRPDIFRELFERELAIYIPADELHPEKWTCPSHSVWRAPSFLDVYCPLAELEIFHGNEKLTNLFNGILGMKDACWYDYITQLEVDSKKKDRLADVADVYRHIYQDNSADKDWESVRYVYLDMLLGEQGLISLHI